MTRDEHLMTIAMEECNEVAQRISKAKRFGMFEVQPGQELSNRMRIRQEFVDLVATLRLIDVCLTLYQDEEIAAKQAKVEEFLRYSEKCGTLTKETHAQ